MLAASYPHDCRPRYGTHLLTNRVIAQLELILELIELIEARTSSIDRETFIANRDEVDLAAFRLGHIGEAARHLPPDVLARHPAIPWRRMYAARNLITHAYRAIDGARIWETARQSLPPL